MTKKEIERKVINILKTLGIYYDCMFDKEVSDIHLERNLDMEWIERVYLAKNITRVFEIEVPDDDEEKWETIGDVADYIISHLKKS